MLLTDGYVITQSTNGGWVHYLLVEPSVVGGIFTSILRTFLSHHANAFVVSHRSSQESPR
jgi:hypothetical protein